MTNSKKQSPSITNANPNYWAMPRKELVELVIGLNQKIEVQNKTLGESIAQTKQAMQHNKELGTILTDMFKMMNQARKTERLLNHKLSERPQNGLETALIRLARHSPAPNMVQSIYRVIELAVFHSDVDIDSTEKENFLPLLEIIGVFKEDSCYSLS
ncbi:hypothetical protein [Roseivirga seohaensis]|uniref:hypothetical protein n=1 Tax=Roseivirga seohaensis TaxID=1914963 RepID=UPI003BA990DE